MCQKADYGTLCFGQSPLRDCSGRSVFSAAQNMACLGVIQPIWHHIFIYKIQKQSVHHYLPISTYWFIIILLHIQNKRSKLTEYVTISKCFENWEMTLETCFLPSFVAISVAVLEELKISNSLRDPYGSGVLKTSVGKNWRQLPNNMHGFLVLLNHLVFKEHVSPEVSLAMWQLDRQQTK